jgi:hypothetical protein
VELLKNIEIKKKKFESLSCKPSVVWISGLGLNTPKDLEISPPNVSSFETKCGVGRPSYLMLFKMY